MPSHCFFGGYGKLHKSYCLVFGVVLGGANFGGAYGGAYKM